MPRLIHLAEYTPPHGGSFIPFLSRVLARAGDRGWSIEVVLPEAARERGWIEDLAVTGARIRFESDSGHLARWIGEMLDESGDQTILHTHFTTYDTAAIRAKRKRPNVHVYWHVHTVLSNSPHVIAANALKFGIGGRYVNRILCPASNIADGISQRRFGPSSRTSVFPSPIDLDAFPVPDRETRTAQRQVLGVPEGSEVLLLFGRAWKLKGGDTFLRAIRQLADQGRPVYGLVNQGGDEARARVTAAGLDDLVSVVGPVGNVHDLYGAADVFVSPSRGEGMPYSIVEALCSGTPVVASDLPGHRFLADHLDACTVVAREARPLAAAIARYLDCGRAETEAMCRDARAWIAGNLDVSAAANRLVGLYEETVAR